MLKNFVLIVMLLAAVGATVTDAVAARDEAPQAPLSEIPAPQV